MYNKKIKSKSTQVIEDNDKAVVNHKSDTNKNNKYSSKFTQIIEDNDKVVVDHKSE